MHRLEEDYCSASSAMWHMWPNCLRGNDTHVVPKPRASAVEISNPFIALEPPQQSPAHRHQGQELYSEVYLTYQLKCGALRYTASKDPKYPSPSANSSGGDLEYVNEIS